MDLFLFRCKRCGQYKTDRTLFLTKEGSPPDTYLSGVLRNYNEVNRRELITITPDNYEILKSSAPAKTDIPSKIRYLLRHIARRSSRPGAIVGFDGQTDCSVCFAADASELDYYFLYAKSGGYIAGDREGTQYHAKLTPSGWEEATRTPTIESPNAFVAMCLSKDTPHAELLERAYPEAMKPAIENDAKYHAIRINDEPFNSDIVFEIMARIKESRFVVADVTDHRNGVYFEGGYAMGMGLPVIWMCHESDLKNCHFDTSHLNHIVWTDDLGKLRKDLANRILATIGQGPCRSSL
jgi:nucleoside 2-deoxyribosyltransferase